MPQIWVHNPTVVHRTNLYFYYHADDVTLWCSGSGPSTTRTSTLHVTTMLGRYWSSDVVCSWNYLNWTGSQMSLSILTTPTSLFVFLTQVSWCIIVIIGHATSLSTAFAIRMSVYPSICHTCDPRLNGSGCRNKFHTIRCSIFLRPYFALMGLGVHPNECIKERHPMVSSEKLTSCPSYCKIEC